MTTVVDRLWRPPQEEAKHDLLVPAYCRVTSATPVLLVMLYEAVTDTSRPLIQDAPITVGLGESGYTLFFLFWLLIVKPSSLHLFLTVTNIP